MIFVADQPKRPNGKVLSKSKALVMLVDLRHAVDGSRRQGWEVACFGNRGHYRPDGSCIHVDEIIIEAQSDWYRSRTWFLPFGDREQAIKRAAGG